MYYVRNRVLIAPLHFNENFGHKQAKTLPGLEQIWIVFPKQRQGEFTPKPIPVLKTFLIDFNECILQIMLMTLYRRLLSIAKIIMTSQYYPQLPLP